MALVRRALPSVTTCHERKDLYACRFAPEHDRRHRLARPEKQAATPASVTVIEAPRSSGSAPARHRPAALAPSLAVSVSGPAGSLSRRPHRGAEANHSLCSSKAFAPTIRGGGQCAALRTAQRRPCQPHRGRSRPQSALWGSEAIGGVIAVDGPAAGNGGTILGVPKSAASPPAAPRPAPRSAAPSAACRSASRRSAAAASTASGMAKGRLSQPRPRALPAPIASTTIALGASGFALRGLSEFDGCDPLTFATLIPPTPRATGWRPGRVEADYGDRDALYAIASASLLGSHNRNLLVRRSQSRRAPAAAPAFEAGTESATIASSRQSIAKPSVRYPRPGLWRLHRAGHARAHQSLTLE